MKKLAFFLLLTFLFTQVVPAAVSLSGDDRVVLFTTDEEKNQEETGNDKDGKKIKLDNWAAVMGPSGVFNSTLPGNAPDEKLHPSPVTDILIPPPNK